MMFPNSQNRMIKGTSYIIKKKSSNGITWQLRKRRKKGKSIWYGPYLEGFYKMPNGKTKSVPIAKKAIPNFETLSLAEMIDFVEKSGAIHDLRKEPHQTDLLTAINIKKKK